MNIKVGESQEEHFAIEDIIVSYSNIEVSHVNDNKAPIKVVATKVIVWLVIISLIIGLFFF